MIQWIITIVILLMAMVWAGKRLYRLLSKSPGKESEACFGCSSDCSSCPFFDPTKFEGNIRDHDQQQDINKTLKSD